MGSKGREVYKALGLISGVEESTCKNIDGVL